MSTGFQIQDREPAWMASLLENAVEAFVTIDERGLMIWANHAAEKMFGWNLDELIGQNVAMLMPSPDRERHGGYIANYLRTGERKIIGIGREVVGKRRNGEVFPMYLSICEAVVGSTRFFGGMIQDLSERNADRDALRSAREFSERLIDAAPIAIVLLNIDGSARRVNRYLQQYATPTASKQSKCTWIADYIAPGDRARMEVFVTAVAEGLVGQHVVAGIFDPDGQTRWLEWSGAPLHEESGEIAGVLLTGVDVTAHRQAESDREQYAEKLGALAEQLANSQESERRRLATDLHDQVGQSLALAKIRLGEIRAKGGATITQAVDDVRTILTEAIDATRSITFELGTSLLYEAGLEDALHALIVDITEKYAIDITFDHDDRGKPLTDEKKAVVFRAARECIMNVIKHARAQRAFLRLRRLGGDLLLEVEDDGVGFDVPARGFQASVTGGFGLFSIQQRIAGFGGTISVNSDVGRGTTVAIRIPLSIT